MKALKLFLTSTVLFVFGGTTFGQTCTMLTSGNVGNPSAATWSCTGGFNLGTATTIIIPSGLTLTINQATQWNANVVVYGKIIFSNQLRIGDSSAGCNYTLTLMGNSESEIDEAAGQGNPANERLLICGRTIISSAPCNLANPENCPISWDQGPFNGPFTFDKDTTPAALPITLISFTAYQSGQAVEVNWVTGSEENTSHFVVERSADARSFQGVGTVKAQGWSSEPLSYQFIDACPLEGRAYYRLRAVDYDQYTEWFGMERVDLQGKSCAKLAVYPNPVVNHAVSVRLNAAVQENSFVALKNNQGRTVYSSEVRTGEQHYQLPRDIPSGMYILEVYTGQERHSARVVIK